jgi:predicted nuclease of predicted toxin-antitoxin system
MNISPITVGALTEAGWNTVRVSTPLAANSSDEAILSYAAEEGRVVCTQDLDFSDLLALTGRDRPSLVTVRMSNPVPDIVTSRLLEVLPIVADDLEQGSTVTIEEEAVRVRTLPIGR